MVPLSKFHCNNQKELYSRVKDYPWMDIFDLSKSGKESNEEYGNGELATLCVNATMTKTTGDLNHTGYVSQVFLNF